MGLIMRTSLIPLYMEKMCIGEYTIWNLGCGNEEDELIPKQQSITGERSKK